MISRSVCRLFWRQTKYCSTQWKKYLLIQNEILNYIKIKLVEENITTFNIVKKFLRKCIRIERRCVERSLQIFAFGRSLTVPCGLKWNFEAAHAPCLLRLNEWNLLDVYGTVSLLNENVACKKKRSLKFGMNCVKFVAFCFWDFV